ncbi:MAG: cytochrome c [Polyangiaceae bacterium]
MSLPRSPLYVLVLLSSACASTPAPSADGAAGTPTATSTSSADSTGSGAPTASASASASTAPATPPAPDEIAAGSTAFRKACASCHDKDQHTYSFVRVLTDLKWPEARVREKIRKGSGPRGDGPSMPAIGTDVLPDADLPALIAYLRSIRTVAP